AALSLRGRLSPRLHCLRSLQAQLPATRALGRTSPRQFGLNIQPTRPALVPLVLGRSEQKAYCDLATALRNRAMVPALSFFAKAIFAPKTSLAIFRTSFALLNTGMAKTTSSGVFFSASETT